MIEKHNNRGFTVIELAIVTVIIAILISAVVAGTDVLEGAKRNTIIKEINQYKAAILNFRLKYEALPGDVNNASSYWTGASDGDGNGYIVGITLENIYAWNHLSKAEFLTKYYDGTYPPYLDSVPESNIGNVRYLLDSAGSGSTQWLLDSYPIYGISSDTFIGIGGDSDDGFAMNGFINSKDTANIDRKIDDGSASAGALVAIKGNDATTYNSGCTEGTDTAYRTAAKGSIDYDLDDNTKGCRLIYFLRGLD